LAAAADFERAQWLRRYGIHQPSFRDRRGEIDPTSEIGQAGFNYAMNNVAGAVGSVQMTYLAGIVKKHQDNGAFYDQTLTGTPGIQLMRREQKTRPAYWVYSLLADRRDDLLAHLHAQGVQASAVHYRNDIYSCFGPQAELPGVAEFMRRTISIPCGWWVGPEQRDYVVGSVRSFA
jgi:dTDP-4-amino-4,6-dideoxygalactose transaminase